MLATILLAALPAVLLAPNEVPAPMIVAKDLTLEKGAVLKQGLLIQAGNITIDGNGATLDGGAAPGDLAALKKAGIGVQAKGVSHVVIRNLRVRGFETALTASGGEGWTIEGCDFSDNYHDPEFGWGDGDRNGGIILTGISKSVIRNNKSNRNWNGLDLWDSHDNRVEKNDLSHCSNVCLKLWTSCRNVITDNNLSYGLRIRPGEVHARDSTSVLIESGSDDNRFERNDVTHGGDGIFIRVLNGWCSTGNVFVENDCSYANNNGFEAWSPGNTYLRNKANHCSYGFWLGGSDHTVLIGNEAAYNGQPDGFHNAPESDFVHGGIVIVHGSGSHTLIADNYCHHNNGAGIVFRGDLGTRGAKWKMFHLIVQNNRLENNRWGLFARFTDWLDLNGNLGKDNAEKDLIEEVSNLTVREPAPAGLQPPLAVLEGPARCQVGDKVAFDATRSSDPGGKPLEYQWHFAGQVVKGAARMEQAFDRPGFYRVGLTVSNGHLSALAFQDFYVTEPVKEMATEGQAGAWGWTMGDNAEGRGAVKFADDPQALVGKSALRVRPDPYRGSDVTALFPKSKDAAWNLSAAKALKFWIKFQNPNNGGFQGPNPIIRLHGGKGALTYTPAFQGLPRNLLGDLPYSEARHGWLYVTMPLQGGPDWLVTETFEGARPPHVDNGLKFTTVNTPVETQESSGLVSTGKNLYCATLDGDRLCVSTDGTEWKEVKNASADLGPSEPTWISGMLAFYPAGGKEGRLLLRRRDPRRGEQVHEVHRLAAYDVATDAWTWLPTAVALGHGCAVVDNHLFGLAHAIGGNFGGPLGRVNLAEPPPVDERSVPSQLPGRNTGWYSRAAQLAAIKGLIYGIKNDWTTPPPVALEENGDRLYCFDPQAFVPSKFAGGDPWKDSNWQAATTPFKDLGPLPFEIGHGAALVPLPAGWSGLVGAEGGLFIVAGCSPSNHEGFGAPSGKYAVYDLAAGKFTVGNLPEPTGTGTSAAFHDGKVFIKRGGMNYGPSNGEMWVVNPLSADEAREIQARQVDRVDLSRVNYVSFQFDSMGWDPFDVWIDGLAFEGAQ